MKQSILWVSKLLFAALLLAGPASAADTAAPDKRAAAEQFGNDIARAFNERDAKALARLIDFHALAVKSAELQELSDADEKAFAKGVESAGFSKLSEAYFRGLDAGKGTVRFMRATDSASPRSLIRFDMGDQGFNYLEFLLRTNEKGQTRTIDWYQLNTGELMSVTLASAGQMFGSNMSMLERIFGGAKVDEATLAKIKKAGELSRAGKYAEALPLFKQLPQPIRDSRIMLLSQATTASMANLPEEYDQALTRMAQLYSDDPAAAFMLMDYHFLRKNTPEVLKSLNAMEKRVGRDGVTCLLRANAYLLSNDFANGLKHTEESIRLEPERLSAHDTRATILVHLERYQEAVDAYRGMETDFGLQFTRDVFLEDATFEKLVASKPFRAWLPK